MEHLKLLWEELARFYGYQKVGSLRKKEDLRKAFDSMDYEFKCMMERFLAVNMKSGMTAADMAKSYIFLLEETHKEEKYFLEHGTYRYSRLSEVMDKVYNNRNYMKKYMTGLAISAILWPQHREYFSFFSKFLKENRKYQNVYLEVGAGHGMFVCEAIQRGDFKHYDIVDFSEESLDMTKRLLEDVSKEKEVNFICSDFLKYSGRNADVISIGEVLEHVENPLGFLKKCHSLVTDEGRVYLTTCINGPQVDHIYLFSTIKELEELFMKTNLEIVEHLYIPYRSYTIERCERQKLPVNVAYVLKRI